MPPVSAGGPSGGRWVRAIMRRPGFWATLAVAILLLLSSHHAAEPCHWTRSTPEGNEGSASGRKILEQEFNEGLISPSPGRLCQPRWRARSARSRCHRAPVPVADQRLGGGGRHLRHDPPGPVHRRALGGCAVAGKQNYPRWSRRRARVVNFTTGMDVAGDPRRPALVPDSPGPLALVNRVRHDLGPEALAGVPADMHVGAERADRRDISAESRPTKLPVVAGVIVVLSTAPVGCMVFRSVVLPLKAILMNVLWHHGGVRAARGRLRWRRRAAAQLHAHGDIQGLSAAGSPLPCSSASRWTTRSSRWAASAEEWDKTGNNEGSRGDGRAADGLGDHWRRRQSWWPSSSAFTLAQLMEVKELGFSLAAAVFIDATPDPEKKKKKKKIVLVPAAMQICSATATGGCRAGARSAVATHQPVRRRGPYLPHGGVAGALERN